MLLHTRHRYNYYFYFASRLHFSYQASSLTILIYLLFTLISFTGFLSINNIARFLYSLQASFKISFRQPRLLPAVPAVALCSIVICRCQYITPLSVPAIVAVDVPLPPGIHTLHIELYCFSVDIIIAIYIIISFKARLVS